jgi:hypothetical protein
MYFQKINIPDPIWNLDGINFPEPSYLLNERHYRNVEDIMPKDLIEKFSKIDLVPQLIRIFIWPKNKCGIWHHDGNVATGRNVALNWVLQGSGVIQFNTEMSKTMAPMRGVHLGKVGNLTDKVDAETDGHGCIINTALPHRVVTGSEGRTTISLAYTHKDIPFLEMVEKFRQINII